MDFNQPRFVASTTSGVDGASEGGRVSTSRQQDTLILYSLPLIRRIEQGGYRGKLTAEPALVDGAWVLRLVHEGEPPAGVPAVWHGRRVVVEAAAPVA